MHDTSGQQRDRIHSNLVEVAGSPLLFGGHPKSGTTLLMSLFDSHRDVLVFPEETKYLIHIDRRWHRRTADYILTRSRITRLGDPDAMAALGRDYRDVNWGVFAARLRRLMAEHPGRRNILPAIILAYAAAAAEAPRKYWAEKSPLNELFFSSARKLWPDMKAVYIVRDPRDVFASYRKNRTEGELTVDRFIRNWRRSIRAWDRFVSHNPNGGCLVPYEDLVTQPKEVLLPLCHRLGIAWDDTLLRPSIRGRLWRGNSMHGQVFGHVSEAAVGRYQLLLTPAECAQFERDLAVYFDRFGWRRETKSGEGTGRYWPRWFFRGAA